MTREEVKLLDIKPPAHLAKSLGYRGRARWVQMYWESWPICKPVCTDNGKKFHFGSQAAWELFSQSFSFVPKCLYLLNRSNSLLLDQRHHLLYGGDKELITWLLKDPDSLKLLEPVSLQKKRDYTPKLKELVASFKTGASFAAGVIAVTLIAGMGIRLYDSFSDPLSSLTSTECQQIIKNYVEQAEVPPPK